MTVCNDCNKEMSSPQTTSCTPNAIIIDGEQFMRVKGKSNGHRCHDCNIIQNKGNYHHSGCDMEVCPKCGGQLISCGCLDDEDGVPNYKFTTIINQGDK